MKVLKTQSLTLLAVLLSALCVSAQTGSARTVTNADLEKYRDARVKADEDYRQNYAKLGMPSPEELEKREADREKRLTDLSLRLQAEREQKEYLERLAQINSGPPVVYVVPQTNYAPAQYGYYPFGFLPFRSHTRVFQGVRFGTISNVQAARDQASLFPSAVDLIRQNHRAHFGGDIFHGNFRSNVHSRIFFQRR